LRPEHFEFGYQHDCPVRFAGGLGLHDAVRQESSRSVRLADAALSGQQHLRRELTLWPWREELRRNARHIGMCIGQRGSGQLRRRVGRCQADRVQQRGVDACAHGLGAGLAQHIVEIRPVATWGRPGCCDRGLKALAAPTL
jgi:hypothetical protein